MVPQICATCGNHYAAGTQVPEECVICADERQWVPPAGQRWTSLQDLSAAGHRSLVREVEPGLVGVGTEPPFAIGQRGLLVRTDEGNVLWDVPGHVDEIAFDAVRELGGLHVLTASHPHFYGAIVEWSRAFDAEIVLPDADVHWLTRPTDAVRTWSGMETVLPGVTLIQCGGHFSGSAVLHWQAGAGGRGALLTGDTIFVTPGEDRVSFLRSAPNRLPLPEDAVRRIVDSVRPYEFDRIYGGWWTPVVRENAKTIVEDSALRYVQWLHGEATSG
jgi:glyoxylase-like metal-dependent hydrolase (beta-lactamase superfamily II)